MPHDVAAPRAPPMPALPIDTVRMLLHGSPARTIPRDFAGMFAFPIVRCWATIEREEQGIRAIIFVAELARMIRQRVFLLPQYAVGCREYDRGVSARRKHRPMSRDLWLCTCAPGSQSPADQAASWQARNRRA